MKRMFTILAVSSSLVVVISGAAAQHATMTDQELMAKLKDTTPAALLTGANGDGGFTDCDFAPTQRAPST